MTRCSDRRCAFRSGRSQTKLPFIVWRIGGVWKSVVGLRLIGAGRHRAVGVVLQARGRAAALESPIVSLNPNDRPLMNRRLIESAASGA